ncbi:hypothetical protein ES708_11669 [subsurface metagenome]
MTLADKLRDRVSIQVKTTTPGPLGETEVWKPVETRHAQVTPLDAKARAVYQQLQSEVSHKVIFRGSVSLSLGNNRLLWKDKTLEPVEPAQAIEGKTIVMVKEI